MIQVSKPLGWFGIFRLSLVQAALGAIVVLTTSTLNRVMVVELALPAVLPGALVGWHYAVQMSRPRWGYGSDVGGARTPWIVGGMVALAAGAIGAACSVALMPASLGFGILLAIVSFFVIGVGVGAAGTNLLALLAAQTAPERKAAAAAIAWIMMIFGFVVTAGVAGAMLDPFSMSQLIKTAVIVCCGACAVATLAVWGIENRRGGVAQSASDAPSVAGGFREALAEIWAEGQSRRFTIFVFVSMLAYSAQDLILEPFAGLIFGYTPGESTQLSGVQNGGVLLGMILTAIVGTTIGKSRAKFMRNWTIAGCLASAVALAAISMAAMVGPTWPLKPTVFALGFANGAFAVAAIGSMMTLASAGQKGREGIRMGLWGASQAIAFGVGGFLGAMALDIARFFFPEIAPAFALVFACEGALFILAAICAARVGETVADDMTLPAMPSAELVSAE